MTFSKPDSSCVRMKWKRKEKKDRKDRIRGARRIMYEQMNGIEKGKGKGEKGWVGQAGEEGWKREEKCRKNKIKA